MSDREHRGPSDPHDARESEHSMTWHGFTTGLGFFALQVGLSSICWCIMLLTTMQRGAPDSGVYIPPVVDAVMLLTGVSAVPGVLIHATMVLFRSRFADLAAGVNLLCLVLFTLTAFTTLTICLLAE
jgi:hypothetical protein